MQREISVIRKTVYKQTNRGGGQTKRERTLQRNA